MIATRTSGLLRRSPVSAAVMMLYIVASIVSPAMLAKLNNFQPVGNAHPTKLKRLGRHKSFDVLGEYLKFGDLFEGHPILGVL